MYIVDTHVMYLPYVGSVKRYEVYVKWYQVGDTQVGLLRCRQADRHTYLHGS